MKQKFFLAIVLACGLAQISRAVTGPVGVMADPNGALATPTNLIVRNVRVGSGLTRVTNVDNSITISATGGGGGSANTTNQVFYYGATTNGVIAGAIEGGVNLIEFDAGADLVNFPRGLSGDGAGLTGIPILNVATPGAIVTNADTRVISLNSNVAVNALLTTKGMLRSSVFTKWTILIASGDSLTKGIAGEKTWWDYLMTDYLPNDPYVIFATNAAVVNQWATNILYQYTNSPSLYRPWVVNNATTQTIHFDWSGINDWQNNWATIPDQLNIQSNLASAITGDGSKLFKFTISDSASGTDPNEIQRFHLNYGIRTSPFPHQVVDVAKRFKGRGALGIPFTMDGIHWTTNYQRIIAQMVFISLIQDRLHTFAESPDDAYYGPPGRTFAGNSYGISGATDETVRGLVLGWLYSGKHPYIGWEDYNYGGSAAGFEVDGWNLYVRTSPSGNYTAANLVWRANETSNTSYAPFVVTANGVTTRIASNTITTGTATATQFAGGGASLTGLNGSQVTSGTVADARIDSAIARDAEVAAAYQPLDADLTTYAGITPSANVQSYLGAANYSAMRTQLGLVIGTDVQAFDADLAIYGSITPSSNVQSLLGAADYAAMRALLGVTAYWFTNTGTANSISNNFDVVLNGGLTVRGALLMGAMKFEANAGVVVGLDMDVTSAATAGTTQGYNLRIDGLDFIKIHGDADQLTTVTNKFVDIPSGVAFRALDNTSYSSYAAGTAYSLTATPAQLDFGTTDPGVTLAKAGTYLIQGWAIPKYNGATYAANQDLVLKLRRTNNTAADLSNGSTTFTMQTNLVFTGSFGPVCTPAIYYTATAGDIVQLFGSVAATPSAGSVDTTAAWITATRQP